MDLHIHSTFSDGELTPYQIILEAINNGVTMVAITDHDEITGYVHGQSIARKVGLTLIPGIELNTDGPDGELHILGYHVDPNSPDLLEHIAWRKQERKEWAEKIVDHLRTIGFIIDFDSCAARASGGIIVRTHIADELCAQGYFLTSQDAYDRLLKKGAPGFIPRAAFTAKDAIDLIHKANGEAYLAHPGIYPFEVPIHHLEAYGLDGIEVYHSKHTASQVTYWEKIVYCLHLKISGGSDHHGPNTRNPYPIGSVKVSDPCREQWLNKKEELFE